MKPDRKECSGTSKWGLEGLRDITNKRGSHRLTIGALIMRIGFWGTLYCVYRNPKESYWYLLTVESGSFHTPEEPLARCRRIKS